jgi:hypothetical protein
MPAGKTAPTEYLGHLRGYLAWSDRQIKVAITERVDPVRRRRVVTPDVLPPGLARMGKPAVELNGRQVGPVEHVAILVVVAAAISALPLAHRQSVWTLDVFVVSPFQNRVQAGSVEAQQSGEFGSPAHLGPAVDGARQIGLCCLPALQAPEYPCARIIHSPSRIGEI